MGGLSSMDTLSMVKASSLFPTFMPPTLVSINSVGSAANGDFSDPLMHAKTKGDLMKELQKYK